MQFHDCNSSSQEFLQMFDRMPEGRDRMSRQEDVLATYSNQRRSLSSGGRDVLGRVNSVVLALEDEADEGQAPGTSLRWRGTALVATPGPVGVALGRGSTGNPRIGRSSALITGRENFSRGGGRGKGNGSSILPSWYPRKPLRDITAVVRAIKKRRAHWKEGEELQKKESPSLSTSAAQLEQDSSTISPKPTIGKVPKILLNITNKDEGDSGSLPPQKKLLNNIDMVEKVVMEELHKLKRTPTAKKAEREKRVRTLLSMR